MGIEGVQLEAGGVLAVQVLMTEEVWMRLVMMARERLV